MQLSDRPLLSDRPNDALRNGKGIHPDAAAFFFAVDRLIDLNERRRAAIAHHSHGMSTLQFIEEFCTVSVDVGRGSGKSQYIKSRADMTDVVVVGSLPLVLEMQRECLAHVIGSPIDKSWGNLIGRTPGERVRLWIDEPSMLPDGGCIEAIHRVVNYARGRPVTVIKLGRPCRSRDTSLPSWSKPRERLGVGDRL